MRVIGGEFRSRRLKTLPGLSLRPTSDRLRETLFNIVGEEIAGRVFVDAYAGSGAVGIEALSRGAACTVFIEKNRKAAAVLRENLQSLGLSGRSRIVDRPADVALALVEEGIDADMVFLDPPYKDAGEYEVCLSQLGNAAQDKARRAPTLVIAEHSSRMELRAQYGALHRVRVLKQGDSSLSFYRPTPRAAA